ncbi:UNVERIFIED_CONTAM: hypothetical protein FKN15_027046 [Acipenser sinensis]
MEHLPDSNSRYKDVDYWDERYKHEESFEWFGNFSNFKHLLELHVRKEDRILVLDLQREVLFFWHSVIRASRAAFYFCSRVESVQHRNSRYKDVDYWDERYKHEESFEWFGNFSNFKHLLELHVRKEDRILVLGCGNSLMSSDMHSCGFTSITNIDYSAVCIEAMAARHRGCPGMDWRQMDARSLTFAEGSFDVVLEKGTLDAMMVEEKDPWHVSPETSETVQQVLKQV